MAEKTRKKQTTRTAKTAKSKEVKPAKTLRTSKSKGTHSVSPAKTEKVEKVTTPRAVRIRRSYVFTLLGILTLVALLYLGRNLIIAATVNGQPISRLSVVRDLEKQGGQQVLDSLITKSLIQQEARKRSASVSQQEVDAEIKKIEDNFSAQGQKLDQVLEMQGMTREQLVEQIQLQKLIEKMVGKKEVTDKEVTDYIESNREVLPQDQDAKTLETSVKERLQQQKLNEEAQAFLEKLRTEAKINYFVQY